MKLSTDRLREQKKENIIVVIAMVAIVVLTLVIFGWGTVKSWLSTPLIWTKQNSLDIHYFGTLPTKSDDEYNIFLGIENKTKKDIDDYELTIEVEGVKFDYSHSYSRGDIARFGLTDVVLSVSTVDPSSYSDTMKISEKKLEKLLDSEQTENVKVSCRIKKLKSDGETIVNNSGILKDILIVVVSLCLGIVGFFGNIEKKWLRIVFKLLATPAVAAIVVVIIGLLLLIFGLNYASSPEGKAAAEESRRRQEEKRKAQAAYEYKSAARAKEAAMARGDRAGAAYAQERMDKSAADMVSGTGSDKNAYKSAAHTKAAATARGDHKTAAYAQAEMDKKMADMLKNKK